MGKLMTEQLTMTDIEREITPDIVAARCQSYQFKGKPLNAFSKTRQVAARCMGNQFFLGRAQPDERGIYPEMFMDAMTVLWLCAVDDARVRRACMRSDAALDEMLEWWEQEGGAFGSTEESEMLNLYGSIIQDLFTVAAEIDTTGTKSQGEALGE